MTFRKSPAVFVALTSCLVLPAIAWAATTYQRTFDPKRGGSICYAREYSDAFRKKHPNVKLTSISLERRSTTSGGGLSSAKRFGLTLSASTVSEAYSAVADCKPKGAGFACSLDSDGGEFTVVRTRPNIRIVTRRIEIEGFYKDLEISSPRSRAQRSFELKGNKAQTCDEVFD